MAVSSDLQVAVEGSGINPDPRMRTDSPGFSVTSVSGRWSEPYNARRASSPDEYWKHSICINKIARQKFWVACPSSISFQSSILGITTDAFESLVISNS